MTKDKPIVRLHYLCQAMITGSYYTDNIKEGAKACRHKDTVFFKREPFNEYDRMAVAVYNQKGIKLGYISRNESAAVANVMDSGFAEECFGEITYINKKRESVGLLADCFFRCEDRYIERLKTLIEESKR